MQGGGAGPRMGVPNRFRPITCLSVSAASAAGEKARRRRWLQLLGRTDCGRSAGLGRWQRRHWQRGPDPRQGSSRRRAPRGQRRRWSCGSVSSIAPHVILLPAALVVLRGGRGPSRRTQGILGTSDHPTAQWPSGTTQQLERECLAISCAKHCAEGVSAIVSLVADREYLGLLTRDPCGLRSFFADHLVEELKWLLSLRAKPTLMPRCVFTLARLNCSLP